MTGFWGFAVVAAVFAAILIVYSIRESRSYRRAQLSITDVLYDYKATLADNQVMGVVATDVGSEFQNSDDEADRWLNFTRGDATVALVRAKDVLSINSVPHEGKR